jgi:hypothetical protein
MNYLLKLPYKYTLSLNEIMLKEDQFSLEFRSLLERYHRKDNTIDENLVFNIQPDFNGNYIRLNIVSPKLPKDMGNEIASTFSSVFINSPALQDAYCMQCL